MDIIKNLGDSFFM